jgi:hypothetical protein
MRPSFSGFKKFFEEMDPSQEKDIVASGDSKKQDYFASLEDEENMKIIENRRKLRNLIKLRKSRKSSKIAENENNEANHGKSRKIKKIKENHRRLGKS